MKRRAFFGFAGGAVASGPSVAKAVLSEMPKGLGISGGAYIGGPVSAGVASSAPVGDWRLDEIARLKRFISGELTDEEKEQDRIEKLHRQEVIISQHAASLVSVSGVQKIGIFNRNMAKVQREIRLSNSKSYLASLLKQVS